MRFRSPRLACFRARSGQAQPARVYRGGGFRFQPEHLRFAQHSVLAHDDSGYFSVRSGLLTSRLAILAHGHNSPRPTTGRPAASGVDAAIHHLRALVHERRRHGPVLSSVAAVGAGRQAPGPVPPRPRALGPLGGRGRRARAGGLHGVRLGRPRQRPLGGSARRCGEFRLLRTGRRAVRPPFVRDRRRADGSDRRHRSQRRRRHRRRVDPRLRPAPARGGAGDACLPHPALSAAGDPGAPAGAEAADHEIRPELREGARADARSGAAGSTRAGRPDQPRHLHQGSARSPRHRRRGWFGTPRRSACPRSCSSPAPTGSSSAPRR